MARYYASHGVPAQASRILLSASSSETYSWLFKLLAGPGETVLVPAPSYPLLDALAGLEDRLPEGLRHSVHPKCIWYFAPSENRHTPVPSVGPLIRYSHCTFTPLLPKALAMPRRPLKLRAALPGTSLCRRPKAA